MNEFSLSGDNNQIKIIDHERMVPSSRYNPNQLNFIIRQQHRKAITYARTPVTAQQIVSNLVLSAEDKVRMGSNHLEQLRLFSLKKEMKVFGSYQQTPKSNFISL